MCIRDRLCTVHCALCTVHCELCTAAQSAPCSAKCALCTMQCRVCTVHHAVQSVHYAPCSAECALCTMQCTHQTGGHCGRCVRGRVLLIQVMQYIKISWRLIHLFHMYKILVYLKAFITINFWMFVLWRLKRGTAQNFSYTKYCSYTSCLLFVNQICQAITFTSCLLFFIFNCELWGLYLVV